MEELIQYLRYDMLLEKHFSRARVTVNADRIKVIYLNEYREPVFEIRGEWFEDLFVIDFVKTYSRFRGTGICKEFFTRIILNSHFRVGIFQVVSRIFSEVLLKIGYHKTDFTSSLGLIRDTVNIGCSYYDGDFGDYIYE